MTSQPVSGRTTGIPEAQLAGRPKGPMPIFCPAVTRLEAEALAYLGWHIKEHKRPPGKIAMAEYLEITGLALGNVIRSLARKGLIYRPPERPDSLELTRPIQ